MSLILKTLGGEPLKTAQNARQRGEELKGLAKGRQVQATVLGPDAKGNIRVRIMGGTVLAESQVPLKQGQTLNLTVEETEPELVFSMADKSNSPQVSRLNLALQEALQNRERLVQGLNNLLHAKETGDAQNARAGEITEKLRQAIRNGALNAKRAGDPEALSRLLRQSGLDLEARLARAARQPGRESRVLANPFPAGTLRGLAKALLRQLGAGMADGADLDSMAQKALQDLRGSAQGLSAALDAATRLNAELLPQKDMLYLPLPMLFGDQVLGGELLLQLPAQDENQERQGQTKLVFFFEHVRPGTGGGGSGAA